MICLSDNDIILKLAICGLFDEALDVLGAKPVEVYVLPTARFKLGVAKNTEKTKARLGEAVFECLRAFLDRVQVINAVLPPEEQQLFDDILGIDAGEAVLFSATALFPDFLLATGDKNSLRALSANAACQSVCQRLAGKVICFEQIVVRIMDRFGFPVVRDKVVPVRACDTALRAVFGSGLDATEENVRAGLDSYISDLRRQTGGLLLAS